MKITLIATLFSIFIFSSEKREACEYEYDNILSVINKLIKDSSQTFPEAAYEACQEREETTRQCNQPAPA